MKLWSSVSCLTLLIASVACARPDEPNVKDKLLGKWEATNGPIKGAIFEFVKDGTLKIAVKIGDVAMNLEGKFSVASSENLEVTFKGPDGKEKTDKVKYKFEGANLNLTDPEGNLIKFTKLK